MIALTTRLNERDEAILQMQEELDTYDKIHRESEVGKEHMRRRVKTLEEFIRRNGMEAPQLTDEDMSDSELPNDKVKIGDCETFNVTYSNLLSPEEKIKELAQIADSRKNKIEELEDQIKNLEADSVQLNGSRSNKHSRTIEASGYESQTYEDIGVIASSVNDIIQKLSQQNSGDVLKHVAKKLLDLQKFTSDILTARRSEQMGDHYSRDTPSRMDSDHDNYGQREVMDYHDNGFEASEKIVDRIFKRHAF